MANKSEGLIIKAVGGLYWVKCKNKLFTCSARGILRKNDTSPMVGDVVTFETDLNDLDKGVIISIKSRKNSLIRPPIANIDNLFIISSIDKPLPNLLIIDKLLAIAEYHDIKANLVISKTDLKDYSQLENIYKNAGVDVYPICVKTGDGIEKLKNAVVDKINVFIGNTGVGKSSALNSIEEGLALKTAQISEKLGRGRHTTRHTELFELSKGGYVADTPGFSTVDVTMYGITDKNDLQFCFKEFGKYYGECKFTGCSHTVEKGCQILNKLAQGEIMKTRHENYTIIYNELKQIKSWEINK